MLSGRFSFFPTFFIGDEMPCATPVTALSRPCHAPSALFWPSDLDWTAKIAFPMPQRSPCELEKGIVWTNPILGLCGMTWAIDWPQPMATMGQPLACAPFRTLLVVKGEWNRGFRPKTPAPRPQRAIVPSNEASTPPTPFCLPFCFLIWPQIPPMSVWRGLKALNLPKICSTSARSSGAMAGISHKRVDWDTTLAK